MYRLEFLIGITRRVAGTYLLTQPPGKPRLFRRGEIGGDSCRRPLVGDIFSHDLDRRPTAAGGEV